EREELRKIKGMNLDVESDEEAKIMGLKNIYKGLLGLKCGSLDQHLLARYYKEQFENLGGEIQFHTKVNRLIIAPKKKLGISKEPFVWQDSRVAGVLTNKGEMYADKIILATGALTNELLDPIGIDSHMKPKKRQVFQIQDSHLNELLNIEGFNDEGTIPFTILPKSGIYMRPVKGEKSFWIGCADDLGRSFSLDTTPEEDFYYYNIYPVLIKYFPQFTNLRVKNLWAGLYAYNTIDGMPYIFEKYGVIVVTGCSGSGLMKADAIGRIVDGLYRGEEFVRLYGNLNFRVSDIGVEKRNVDREEFLL
ncbi:MAG: FAD-binding oxidoreductase, partial [Nitrososphaerales archaeon]